MTDLRQAAKAVVDRWDSPKWEWRDQGPTADLMADLRKALAQPEQEPVAWMSVSGDWVTTSKPVMENHASKCTVLVPLYK